MTDREVALRQGGYFKYIQNSLALFTPYFNLKSFLK